jgi:hypothetical protein
MNFFMAGMRARTIVVAQDVMILTSLAAMAQDWVAPEQTGGTANPGIIAA